MLGTWWTLLTGEVYRGQWNTGEDQRRRAVVAASSAVAPFSPAEDVVAEDTCGQQRPGLAKARGGARVEGKEGRTEGEDTVTRTKANGGGGGGGGGGVSRRL